MMVVMVVVGLDHLLSISLGDNSKTVLLAPLLLMLNDLLAEGRRVLRRNSARKSHVLISFLMIMIILNHETASV
jgi:hypothetical protein